MTILHRDINCDPASSVANFYEICLAVQKWNNPVFGSQQMSLWILFFFLGFSVHQELTKIIKIFFLYFRKDSGQSDITVFFKVSRFWAPKSSLVAAMRVFVVDVCFVGFPLCCLCVHSWFHYRVVVFTSTWQFKNNLVSNIAVCMKPMIILNETDWRKKNKRSLCQPKSVPECKAHSHTPFSLVYCDSSPHPFPSLWWGHCGITIEQKVQQIKLF